MLKDKDAIVKSTTRSLGFEILKEFAEAAATVILRSRSMPSKENSTSQIKCKTHPEILDVINAQPIIEFMHLVMESQKHIDTLINSAGYPFVRMRWNKRFHEVDKEDNIASTPANADHTTAASYSIAKSSVIAITKHDILEYGDKNIRANTLAVGNFCTEPTFPCMTFPERKKVEMENSMKPWGDTSEVVTFDASVASKDFAFVHGNKIVIDRGAVML